MTVRLNDIEYYIEYLLYIYGQTIVFCEVLTEPYNYMHCDS